jgi:hypothetical protein
MAHCAVSESAKVHTMKSTDSEDDLRGSAVGERGRDMDDGVNP